MICDFLMFTFAYKVIKVTAFLFIHVLMLCPNTSSSHIGLYIFILVFSWEKPESVSLKATNFLQIFILGKGLVNFFPSTLAYPLVSVCWYFISDQVLEILWPRHLFWLFILSREEEVPQQQMGIYFRIVWKYDR